MDIIISNTSSLPIYEQIYSQIKNAIMAGQLVEGNALPSIRMLAKDLRISVITTKRAYDELERDGFINIVAGKGCYVSGRSMELLREEHLKEIENHLRSALALSRTVSLSRKELNEILDMLEEEFDERD